MYSPRRPLATVNLVVLAGGSAATNSNRDIAEESPDFVSTAIGRDPSSGNCKFRVWGLFMSFSTSCLIISVATKAILPREFTPTESELV